MKAIKQYFHVVLFMLYKVILTSVHETLTFDHLNECFRAAFYSRFVDRFKIYNLTIFTVHFLQFQRHPSLAVTLIREKIFVLMWVSQRKALFVRGGILQILITTLYQQKITQNLLEDTTFVEILEEKRRNLGVSPPTLTPSLISVIFQVVVSKLWILPPLG